MAWVQHDFVIRDFHLLTAMEKISRNGHFNDLSNVFKIIQLVSYICSEKNFKVKKRIFDGTHGLAMRKFISPLLQGGQIGKTSMQPTMTSLP